MVEVGVLELGIASRSASWSWAAPRSGALEVGLAETGALEISPLKSAP